MCHRSLRFALAITHVWADVHLQAIVRGVCAIIDAFHFDISSQVSAQEEAVEGEGKIEEALQEEEKAESAHKAIQSALTRRVLPGLRAQLVHDGEVSCHIQYLHSPETAAAHPHQSVPYRTLQQRQLGPSIIIAGACCLVATYGCSVLASCT